MFYNGTTFGFLVLFAFTVFIVIGIYKENQKKY